MRDPHVFPGSNRFRLDNEGHGHMDLYETPSVVPVALVRSSGTPTTVGASWLRRCPSLVTWPQMSISFVMVDNKPLSWAVA